MVLVVVAAIGAALLATMLGVALFDLVFRPGFRRLAVRNIARRRTETLLVVLGSSLGTAIIAASFLVGATFNASVRDGARTRLGPIDQEVTLANASDVDRVMALLSSPSMAHVDGVLPTVRASASVTTSAAGAVRVEPAADVAEVNFDAARRFGGHPDDTGFSRAGVTPGSGDAVIGSRLATKLAVRAGDTLVLHAYGADRPLVVRTVLPEIGVAGSADLFVAPGTLKALNASSAIAETQAPIGQVAVSDNGRVFNSTDNSDAVAAEIRSRTASVQGVNISSSKSDLLRDARDEGRSMGTLYTGVGVFSVLAGILLLVNLFVMVAEERKRELGLTRAMGLKRWHLIRIFTLEGAMYAVAAAFVGSFAGTVVGWLIAGATGRLFRQSDSDFTLRFVAPTGDLVIAALIGLGLAMATVWITSFRIANLNIIQALHELPEVPHRRHRLRSSGPASVLVLLGAGLAIYGVVAVVPLAAVVGPPIAFVGAFPLLRPILGRRLTTGTLSVATLVWCIGIFTFLTRITDKAGVPIFVVQGVIMVAAAVGLSTALDRLWTVMLEGLTRTGRGLAGRLGLAYPLDRLFRTSMLLAMYALIIFTLTFLSVYGRIFGDQAATFTSQASAGADLMVDTNQANPVSAATLAKAPGVASVATLVQSAPEFTAPFQHVATQWSLTGFDADLLRSGTPALSQRAAGYASDRAVFEAMLGNPSLLVVDEQFLSITNTKTPDGALVTLGDEVTAINPSSGARRRLKVVGLMDRDIPGVGAYASSGLVRSLMGSSAVPGRFFVRVDTGLDSSRVANQLNVDFSANGVDARTFRSLVNSRISVELGFFKLMQSYMTIGLVVGIFGLAVVMVRAARERRHQVGMLRTIGFSADVVRHAFLVEAAFIALQGIATGVGLGLLVSYQMLSHSAALGGDPLPYAVPWMTILMLAVIPFAASLAVALIPASQAASLNPAEVIRLTD